MRAAPLKVASGAARVLAQAGANKRRQPVRDMLVKLQAEVGPRTVVPFSADEMRDIAAFMLAMRELADAQDEAEQAIFLLNERDRGPMIDRVTGARTKLALAAKAVGIDMRAVAKGVL
jgi:hypothetical protein